MPLRLFNNFTSQQIYRFFLSLFGIYHVNSIEDSSSTSSSITATFSSEIVLNSIIMIQPMNDMDKWSTYFWIKRLSALFYYVPYYKTNKYSNKNANPNFINTMTLSSPVAKITATARARATTETVSSTLASNKLCSSSYSSTSSNSTIVPSITANLSSLSFKNITINDNINHELTTNESLYPSLLSSSSLQTELTLTSPPSPPMIILIKQLLMIQKQTRDIIHQLDHLRPSEIFAKSSRTALAIHQCLRFSTDMLRSHSILALLNIMGILQELLDHSPSELKRQVFYKAKLGRFMILEMATILKTSSLASLSTVSLFYYDKHYNNNNNNLDIMISQSSLSSTLCEKDLDLHHWIQFLITSLQPPTLINQEGWILDWLKLVCISISTYDKSWVHRQEYENVISLAAHYL